MIGEELTRDFGTHWNLLGTYWNLFGSHRNAFGSHRNGFGSHWNPLFEFPRTITTVFTVCCQFDTPKNDSQNYLPGSKPSFQADSDTFGDDSDTFGDDWDTFGVD